jgi:SAM-dependent methyltransferase
MHDPNDIKTAVRERYAGHATAGTSCCPTPRAGAASASAGCGCGTAATPGSISTALGYDAEELDAIPEGADLGLGCGNPLALMELAEGETVLDLGSGGGIDCFVAARRVGASGRVIGVDMTPEMIQRARRNAASVGASNVEFRLGEVEHLPVADGSVDVIISNCVINLVPDKAAVFAEAFRVLRAGGRVSVSDIVLLGEVPLEIRDSVEAYVACLSGAVLLEEYLGGLEAAGFTEVTVTEKRTFAPEDVVAADLVAEFMEHTGADRESLLRAANSFASVRVSAKKPE